jgi:hypothetical protein
VGDPAPDGVNEELVTNNGLPEIVVDAVKVYDVPSTPANVQLATVMTPSDGTKLVQ